LKNADLLRKLARFSHFTDPQIEQLGACLARTRLPADARIFNEKDDGTEAYLLAEGRVRLFRDTAYGSCVLSEVAPRQLFGEESYVDGGARTQHAETIEASELLSFNPVALSVVEERDPSFAVALYWAFWRSLAVRLRATNQELLRFFEAPEDSVETPQQSYSRTPTGEFRIALSEKREVFHEQRLSSMEIQFLSSLSQEKQLPAGEMIFREGDAGDRMYVVLSGKVRISKQIPGAGEEALAILERGDYFGEMALIDNLPRSADARAHTGGAVVLIIPKDVIGAILDPRKVSSLRLLKILSTVLAQRLRAIEDKITSWFVLTGPGQPLS
jgi:CRP-like cAMP-binding protein